MPAEAEPRADMVAVWRQIVRTVRWYPSPHNSQPLRIRVVDELRAEIFYDMDRGLPAEPYGIPFGSVCAGIFLELFAITAHEMGFEVDEDICLGDMDFTAADRLHRVATVALRRAPRPIDDLDPGLISARCTSRLPYGPGTVDPGVVEALTAEAAVWGHGLSTTGDRDLVRAVAHLNQRTLFEDVGNDAVRRELKLWLRYSTAEAELQGDGLSAECLNLPGPLLRWFVEHHRWWSRSVLEAVARRVYLRSMRGFGQLMWLTGPFATTTDHQRAGRLFIRLWLLLTRHGIALHPLGSVITNPRSHREFVSTVGEIGSSGMSWMLARIGYSASAPRSHRLPASALLLPRVGGPVVRHDDAHR
jgi:hypothetical protein